jgi:hypothetical protein
MSRSHLASVICFTIIAIPMVAAAKGATTKIELRGDGIARPIEITDPQIVGRFSIWNGPGVSTASHGKQDPPAWADPAKVDGRFVDWPRGWADQRPSGLQRVEVTLFIGGTAARGFSDAGRYVFMYEVDPTAQHGYVYLPQFKNELILHFVEGNWLHAAQAWDATMLPLVARATAGDYRAQRAEFGCAIAVGSISRDGTIELRGLGDPDRASGSSLKLRPADRLYAGFRALMGDVEPERETRVSCWPSRT